MLSPETSLRETKGIGERRFFLLKERGFSKVEDLLLYLPKKYEKRGRIVPLSEAEGEAEVLVNVIKRKWRRGKRLWILEAEVEDRSGKAKVIWFNKKYLHKIIFPGTKLYLKGKVERGMDITIKAPEVKLQMEDGIVPIYERIGSLSSNTIRRIIENTLRNIEIKETLPEEIIREYNFPSRKDSFVSLHMPGKNYSLQGLNSGNTKFHRRLIFEEAFFYHLSLLYLRQKSMIKKNREYTAGQSTLSRIKAIFPFEFTGAQEKALEEISSDLFSPYPMRRLLQGEVGSGKTAVAVSSALIPAISGYQVAFMAPTEVLAEQHYKRLTPILKSLGIKTALLTSGINRERRRETEFNIETGRAGFIFGTHALLYEGINFHNLAYAIIDEQQRFGVTQRAKLYNKGKDTDFLLLSATPIPRTLALILYSDLKLSTLREMPRKREVETKVLRVKKFGRIAPFIEELLRKGLQGFAIFPVIERSKTELIDAERGKKRLEEYFPKARIELLHGRMKTDEKREKMERFERGEIDILASTTVVEVGIDMERAGFMVVFNAERFGLAQLHQLRGRIGRGKNRGYFFLLSELQLPRLKYLEKISDGFKVSEIDLRLRGPGNLAGKEQWGIPKFRLLNPLLHEEILYASKQEASKYLSFMENKFSNIIGKEISVG